MRALDLRAPLSLVLVVIVLMVAVYDPAAAVTAASVLLPAATGAGHSTVRYLRIRRD
ncbi:hypothetical protein [Streptomyces xanthochromogenes]|uniref:hypothetical protein n=1 Tax=Streptomyces xanthochromogenes TaxID=67384 RepID=UPI00341F7225